MALCAGALLLLSLTATMSSLDSDLASFLVSLPNRQLPRSGGFSLFSSLTIWDPQMSFGASIVSIRPMPQIQGSSLFTFANDLSGYCRISCWFKPPVPRQKFIKLLSWILCNARENICEPGLWIDAVHLSGDDKTIHGGSANAAAIWTAE